MVDDLFAYDATNGSLWVGRRTESGFDLEQWATVDPVAGWQFTVGDFTGNGRAEIMGYHPNNGTLWVGENSGTSFDFSEWAVVDPPDGWHFDAGYFLGHAKSDLFAYHPSNGSLWVAENTGTEFVFEQWGTVDPVAGWQFVAGDFTGNGRTDVVGYHPSNGSIWIGENLGEDSSSPTGRQSTRPGTGSSTPAASADGRATTCSLTTPSPERVGRREHHHQLRLRAMGRRRPRGPVAVRDPHLRR